MKILYIILILIIPCQVLAKDLTNLYAQLTPGAVCGNSVCESGETAAACPEDCGEALHIGENFVGIDIFSWLNYEEELPYIAVFDFINLFDVDRVVWDWIEPSQNDYYWSYLDDIISEIEKVEGTATFNIWVTSNWATRMSIYNPGDYRSSSPPRKYKDLRNFLTNLVKRYEGHNYYQILSEPENNWQGTKEEYVQLLNFSYDTIKRANPNARIVSGAWNLGDAFDDNPTPQQVEQRAARLPEYYRDKFEFVKYLLKNGKYDVVGTNCNYAPSGLQARMNWIRTFTSKPVWCSDMAHAPLLRGQLFYPLYSSEEIPYVHGDYMIIKINAAKDAGYERVSLQHMVGCPYSGDGDWAYGCLFKPDGNPTPAYDVLKEYLTTPSQSSDTSTKGERFGGCFAFYGAYSERTTQRHLNAFSKTFYGVGMGTARFDVYWGMLEPEKGVYNWTLADDLLSTVDGDTDVLFQVYSTSEWGSSYKDCKEFVLNKFGVDRFNGPPSSVPVNMGDYMDFLDAIVNRYGDRVRYWQIENEVYGAQERAELPGCPFNNFWLGTKEEYVELLKNSYAKIKSIDPKAIVLASSIAFGPWYEQPIEYKSSPTEFIEYTLSEGKNHMDAVDLHLYGCVEDVPLMVSSITQRMDALGIKKPLVSTEHGEIDLACDDYKYIKEFSLSTNSPEELRLQSEDIVKRHVIAFSSGIKRMLLLRLNIYTDDESPNIRWNHMGLASDIDGVQKKPGYYTYKMMTSKLAGFTSVEKVVDGVYRFSFSSGNPVFVAWSDNEATVNLFPYFSTPNVKVTHIVTELDENKNPVYPAEQIVSTGAVYISGNPVFIESTQATP